MCFEVRDLASHSCEVRSYLSNSIVTSDVRLVRQAVNMGDDKRPMSLQPTIYLGTFIHTLPSSPSASPGSRSNAKQSIAQFTILENAAVFVNDRGVIVHIVENVPFSLANTLDEEDVLGWAKREVPVVDDGVHGREWRLVNPERRKRGQKPRGEGSSWWFPGFVGKQISIKSVFSLYLSLLRFSLSVLVWLSMTWKMTKRQPNWN